MFRNAYPPRRSPAERRLHVEALESRHLLSASGVVGDANNDGIVNGLDINLVAMHWLSTGAQPLPGDVNADGHVNGLDLNIIATNWMQRATPPSVTVPAGPLSVNQNLNLAITGVSVADSALSPSTSTVKLTLSVGHGALTLATNVTGGLTSGQVSQNGTTTVTVTAPLAAINATLATANGLLYTPTSGYFGPDTFLASMTDLGHTSSGIPQTVSRSTQITVTVPSVAPTDVPGLQFWLDPYDTSTMTLTNVAETKGSPTSNLQSTSGTPFDFQGNGTSSQFTMAFWVYPERTWSDASWLMANAKNTFRNNDISWFLSIANGATGTLRTTYSTASSTSTLKDYAGAMPVANQWYFVVITYDGSQVGTATTQDQLRQQVYVNGQQIPTPAGDSLPQKIYAAANAGKLYLGAVDAAINNTTPEQFQDVGFWNHWISSSTAAALWNGGAGVTYATLPAGANDPFAYYSMNEASGTRFDSTSNHYDLSAGSAGVGSVQEISAWRDKSQNHITMLFGYNPDTGIQQRQFFGVYSLTARDGLPGVVMPAGAWAYAASTTISTLSSGNLFMNVQLDAPNRGENELFDFSDDVTDGQDSFMGINYIGPNTAPDAGPPAGSGNPNTSTYVPTFHTHAGNAVTHAGGWTANILNINGPEGTGAQVSNNTYFAQGGDYSYEFENVLNGTAGTGTAPGPYRMWINQSPQTIYVADGGGGSIPQLWGDGFAASGGQLSCITLGGLASRSATGVWRITTATGDTYGDIMEYGPVVTGTNDAALRQFMANR
ncbi:MAG TPA: LamG-like jellyroll fold domain-containing protein [Pirellulales bacterium]